MTNDSELDLDWWPDNQGIMADDFLRWMERELPIYRAQAGPDGTLAGFRGHVLEVLAHDPEVGRLYDHTWLYLGGDFDAVTKGLWKHGYIAYLRALDRGWP